MSVIRKKMRFAVMLAAVAGLAGCADYSGVEKELHEVRDQLGQVSKDVDAMKTSLDNATEETRQAAQKAGAATSTANQALTLAHADNQAIERLNEKLDRLERAGRKPTKKTSAGPKKPAAEPTPPSPPPPAQPPEDGAR